MLKIQNCLCKEMVISEFFCHSDFTWNHFEDCRSSKIVIFHFERLWTLFLTKISLQKLQKNPSKSNFRASKISKLEFLELWNWFHVKSDWQESSKIITLCIRDFEVWALFLPFQSCFLWNFCILDTVLDVTRLKETSFLYIADFDKESLGDWYIQ